MSIFKAYDIRGVYGKDLNEDIAYKLGKAYGEIRKEETKKDSINIVVAGDMRVSTPQLKKALISGLLESGINVIDIGLAATPTLYFSVGYFNYDGGIVVSASHNPPEWNGFKLTREKALPIGITSGMKLLEKKILCNEFSSSGKGSLIARNDVLNHQIEHDIRYADIASIKSFKVVADAANAMGSLYLDLLFKHLKCKLVKMNFELDGTFPNHEPDPFKEKNLQCLKKRVVEEKADLGISTDGDGDRIFFIDENGNTIDQSIIRGVLAMIFLRERPKSKICYDIRPGRITKDIIEENGGIPIVTKVGHSLIKEHVIKENAYFAGESSGHFFLNTDIGCFEVPTIVVLKLLQEFSQSGKTVSEYIKIYKKYWHSGEINFIVKDKEKILNKVKSVFKDGILSEIDGISIEYDDWWMNIRSSNTEPLLRLNLEARTKKKMNEMKEKIINIIKSMS